jgi:hypothetical protein
LEETADETVWYSGVATLSATGGFGKYQASMELMLDGYQELQPTLQCNQR